MSRATAATRSWDTESRINPQYLGRRIRAEEDAVRVTKKLANARNFRAGILHRRARSRTPAANALRPLPKCRSNSRQADLDLWACTPLRLHVHERQEAVAWRASDHSRASQTRRNAEKADATGLVAVTD